MPQAKVTLLGAGADACPRSTSPVICQQARSSASAPSCCRRRSRKRDWSASNNINDPITPLVVQFGPNGEAQQKRDYWNDEVNQLSVVMETSMDKGARLKAHARLLEICEREDPAYTVLHQNAVFTGMKSELNWKAAPAFAMDFRACNWGGLG